MAELLSPTGKGNPSPSSINSPCSAFLRSWMSYVSVDHSRHARGQREDTLILPARPHTPQCPPRKALAVLLREHGPFCRPESGMLQAELTGRAPHPSGGGRRRGAHGRAWLSLVRGKGCGHLGGGHRGGRPGSDCKHRASARNSGSPTTAPPPRLPGKPARRGGGFSPGALLLFPTPNKSCLTLGTQGGGVRPS